MSRRWNKWDYNESTYKCTCGHSMYIKPERDSATCNHCWRKIYKKDLKSIAYLSRLEFIRNYFERKKKDEQQKSGDNGDNV